MKHLSNLHIVFVVALMVGCSAVIRGDDYIDDVYYSAQTAFEEELKQSDLTPYYDKKKMQELHFVQDTLPSPDATPERMDVSSEQTIQQDVVQ